MSYVFLNIPIYHMRSHCIILFNGLWPCCGRLKCNVIPQALHGGRDERSNWSVMQPDRSCDHNLPKIFNLDIFCHVGMANLRSRFVIIDFVMNNTRNEYANSALSSAYHHDQNHCKRANNYLKTNRHCLIGGDQGSDEVRSLLEIKINDNNDFS